MNLSNVVPIFQKSNTNISFDETLIRVQNINKDSLIMDTLKPNSSMILAGTHVKINSLGFRDYEYSLKKPNNTFRIAVLGDSFTFGYGVTIDETYVKQLEVLLNKKYDKNVEVLNFGGNAGNTLLEAEYLKEKVLDFEPNLVIVGFAANDVDVEYISDKEYYIKNSEKLGKIHDFLSNTKSYNYVIIDRYNSIKKQYNYTKFILQENMVKDNQDLEMNYYFFSIYDENYQGLNCFKESVKRFSETSNENNLKIIFLLIPTKLDENLIEIITNKISLILEYNNIPYYDLYPYFKHYFGNSNFDLNTKIGAPHYNKLGNEIIANATFEILIKSINI